MCDNDYQLVTHTLFGIIHKAKQRPKSVGKKKQKKKHKKYVKIRKLIRHPVLTMKLAGTCSLLKESHEKKKKKKKKKWDSYFWGVGLLLFGWDSYFL